PSRRSAPRPGGWWPVSAERIRRLVAMPAGLAVVLGLLYLWVSGQELDSIERRTLNADYLVTRVTDHLWLTVLATVLVVAIAIPLGVLLSRPAARWLSPVVLALANLGQATPAIGLLVLLTMLFGVGFGIALAGLVLYAVLPVLRNTIVGIQQVDPALKEAARGMGMTRAQVLWRVELKLAI